LIAGACRLRCPGRLAWRFAAPGWAVSQVFDGGEQCRGGVGEVVSQHPDLLGGVPLEHLAHSAPCGLQGRADLIVVGKSAKMLHHLAGSLGRRLVARNDAPVIAVVP